MANVLVTYLVESYWPGVTEDAFRDGAVRARAAAREMRASGEIIEFVGCTLVAADEVAFWRFAGESRAAVEEISSRAGLRFDRVSECLDLAGKVGHVGASDRDVS